MMPDQKTITLVATAVLVLVTGVLISQGWLDQSFGGMVIGLITGAGGGSTIGYSLGRSLNKATPEEKEVLEQDKRLHPFRNDS